MSVDTFILYDHTLTSNKDIKLSFIFVFLTMGVLLGYTGREWRVPKGSKLNHGKIWGIGRESGEYQNGIGRKFQVVQVDS